MLPYGCIWILSKMCACGVACVLTQIPAELILFFAPVLINFVSSDSIDVFSSAFLPLLCSLKRDETGSEGCCLER